MCAGPKCTFSEHVWIKKKKTKKSLQLVSKASYAKQLCSVNDLRCLASRTRILPPLLQFCLQPRPPPLLNVLHFNSSIFFLIFFFYSWSLYAERLFLIISHKTSDEAKSYFAACKAELVHGEVQKESDFKKRRKKKWWQDCVVCVACAVSNVVVRVINSSVTWS